MTRVPNFFSTGSKKILHFTKEIALWQDKRVFPPIVLEIHPTERCNHACPHCQAQLTISRRSNNLLKKQGADLDFPLLETVWEYPPQAIIISGNTGDPLVHPTIGDLFDSIYERQIPCVLITNGKNLTEVLIHKALRTCVGIRVSMDADCAELYQKTHGVRHFEWQQLLNNVKLLSDIRSQHLYSCDIGVGYLTNEQTRGGIVQATRIARGLGVDYIQFRPFHYDTTDVLEEIEEAATYQTDNFEVYASYQKYDILGKSHRPYTQCHGAYFFSVLDARGDVYMCCHTIKVDSARLGNISQQSWQSLLESQHKRTTIDSFSVQHCIPLCRLHAVNTTLEEVKDRSSIEPPELPEKILRHVMFL